MTAYMDILQIADAELRDGAAIVFPLRHAGAGKIFDVKDHSILDIRGWGRIQYHVDGITKAAMLQDAIADWVVETLNAQYYATKAGT
jgi:hypothetical protein